MRGRRTARRDRTPAPRIARPSDSAAHSAATNRDPARDIAAKAGCEHVRADHDVTGRPGRYTGNDDRPGASIGVALSSTVLCDADGLLRDADVAMYAPRPPARHLQVFSPAMQPEQWDGCNSKRTSRAHAIDRCRASPGGDQHHGDEPAPTPATCGARSRSPSTTIEHSTVETG